MIFMGRSGPPVPSVSAHIRVSNSLNSHFFFFFAGPCQFTKLLQSISAVAVETTTTVLGANHDVAHKAPTSMLRYDTAENSRADVTSVITCIYCRINIE